jgi:hypothetical protein
MTATTQPLPIPLAPATIPARTCEHCREPLVRKHTRPRPERPHEFAARRFCNSACAAHGLGSAANLWRGPNPKPAQVVAFPVDPQAFTRVYQHWLARGVDLLELNDATWETS